MSVSPLHLDSAVTERVVDASRSSGKRTRHVLWRIVQTVVAVVVVLVLGIMAMMGVAQLRARNGITVVLNHAVLTVLSGSMIPTFAPGDVVIDRPLKSGEATRLHAGEIITFREPGTSLTSGPLVTHRIVGVTDNPAGATTGTTAATTEGDTTPAGTSPVGYQTRGDNNNVADPWTVTPSDVVGIYQRHIPKVGYLIQGLHSRWTIVVALILAFIWIGEGEFRKRWRRAGQPTASDGASQDAERNELSGEGG